MRNQYNGGMLDAALIEDKLRKASMIIHQCILLMNEIRGQED